MVLDLVVRLEADERPGRVRPVHRLLLQGALELGDGQRRRVGAQGVDDVDVDVDVDGRLADPQPQPLQVLGLSTGRLLFMKWRNQARVEAGAPRPSSRTPRWAGPAGPAQEPGAGGASSVILAPSTTAAAISPDWSHVATTSGFCSVEVETSPDAPNSAATALAPAPTSRP